jgi:ElaB/YqjD/DUF883 family membrane-anchored ribosome-binding protein
MKPRATLPNVTDEPRRAFDNGWYSGIAVGIAIGVAVGILLVKGVA